jgi:HK97 family phage major capsid protein
MPTIQELRDKRNKLLTDAQGVALKDVKDVTELDSFERMLTEVETLEKQIDIAERAEAKLSEERSRTKPPRANHEDRKLPAEQEARTAAFEKYVRFGKDELTSEERTLLRGSERRDLLTSGTGPAYLIPQGFYPTLIEAQKYVGAVINEVTRKETNNHGAPMKISLANDTGNILTTMTEGVSLSDTDPSFTGFILSTDTVATLIKVSVQELEDSYFNLDAWIKKSFGVRYARGLDQYILQGNGSNVASLASGAASALSVNAAAATGPVYDDFTAVYGALDASYVYNSKWAFNQATRAYIMGLKDNYGRPLFIVSPNSGTLDQILGQDVVITPNLPNAFNNTSTTATVNGILLGDFEQGYVFRTDGPLAIRRLDERYMDALEVGFIAYSRIGGAFVDAGTHPVAALITPAS